MRTALLAGATGLTGGHLLTALLGNPEVAKVTALVRKPVLPAQARLDELVVDYAKLPKLPRADVAFCCLGTTIKKAGSQAAFRQVDFDFVIAFAKAARQAGCQQFLVVSAIGADAKSSVFYSRVKGEAEQALRNMGFATLHIFQPSFLMGERAESRPGERMGIAAFSLLAPLMAGPLRKYRPVASRDVALAMMQAAQREASGVFVHDTAGIVAAASASANR